MKKMMTKAMQREVGEASTALTLLEVVGMNTNGKKGNSKLETISHVALVTTDW